MYTFIFIAFYKQSLLAKYVDQRNLTTASVTTDSITTAAVI